MVFEWKEKPLGCNLTALTRTSESKVELDRGDPVEEKFGYGGTLTGKSGKSQGR